MARAGARRRPWRVDGAAVRQTEDAHPSATSAKPVAHAQLDVAETFIRSDPEIKIDVVGHADRPARTATANARISQQRAENVRAELEIRGIDPARFMEVSGAGAAACPVSGREPSCRKAEVFLFPREGASGSHR